MKFILINLFCIIAWSLSAQTPVKVDIGIAKGTITINNLKVTPKTTADDFIKALGKPERVSQYKEKDRLLSWDSQGIAIDLGMNGGTVPEQININFGETDEIQKPHGVFTGTLTVGGVAINSYSSPATFNGIDGVEAKKMNPVFYMGGIESMNLILALEFDARSNKLVNMGFGFKR